MQLVARRCSHPFAVRKRLAAQPSYVPGKILTTSLTSCRPRGCELSAQQLEVGLSRPANQKLLRNRPAVGRLMLGRLRPARRIGDKGVVPPGGQISAQSSA